MRWRWRLYLSVIGSIGSSKWSARRPIVNSFPYNSIKQRYLPMCSNILSESNSWKDSPVTTRIRLDISEVFRIREREKRKEKKEIEFIFDAWILFLFPCPIQKDRLDGQVDSVVQTLLEFDFFFFSTRIIFSLRTIIPVA